MRACNKLFALFFCSRMSCLIPCPHFCEISTKISAIIFVERNCYCFKSRICYTKSKTMLSTLCIAYFWLVTSSSSLPPLILGPASALFGASSRCCISAQSHSFVIHLFDTVGRLRTKQERHPGNPLGSQPAKTNLPILNLGRLKENAGKLCRRRAGIYRPRSVISFADSDTDTEPNSCHDLSVHLVLDMK